MRFLPHCLDEKCFPNVLILVKEIMINSKDGQVLLKGSNLRLGFLDFLLKLGDWNIPKIPTSEIYKSSWSFKKIFKIDYHVKTIKQVYGINKEYETCYFLTPTTIKAHKKQGHNFLYIGLVQVGVKTLIRKGLNSSILMALRDTRYIRFNDSLLGTIETNLSGGPVHFNCLDRKSTRLNSSHRR